MKRSGNFRAKPNSSRNLVASTIRKSAEVTLRQLDQKGRKEFQVAKSAEVQSWFRYEAVTAALRSQYHHRDMVLRYKESGKPKARLVIIGYHDPRVGSDVRTGALVASRCGRGLFYMPPVTISSPLKRGTSRTRFFKERLTTRHMVNLPQSQLRKALNLREDEIVVLTKACYGLIDAPRRWWKSLVRDTQQLGWRSCRHEPCLTTWHVRGRLKGLVCFHVDDVMISGPKGDPDFKRMMDKVKSWNSTRELRPKDQSHHDVCTPTQAHVRNLVSGITHNIDGKTCRAELVSNAIHD